MISVESIEELLVKLKTWKSEVEKKGLRVNDYGDWHSSGPADFFVLENNSVCLTGVGSIAIFCGGCMCWIHKKMQ